MYQAILCRLVAVLALTKCRIRGTGTAVSCTNGFPTRKWLAGNTWLKIPVYSDWTKFATPMLLQLKAKQQSSKALFYMLITQQQCDYSRHKRAWKVNAEKSSNRAARNDQEFVCVTTIVSVNLVIKHTNRYSSSILCPCLYEYIRHDKIGL